MEIKQLSPEVISFIQNELNKSKFLKSPAITKISEYLKQQNVLYHEIQRIPNHLLPKSILEVLKKHKISLFKPNKSGNHIRLLKEIPPNDFITYIFIVKENIQNNLLLCSNHIYAAY